MYDTHATKLSRFLLRKDLHTHFPEYKSYEIMTDVTGIVKDGDKVDLVFVECKLQPITLGDISQLLGYSRVALPLCSLLLSPKGISSSVSYLFNTLRRYDVLKYADNKRIVVARWNPQSNDLDFQSIIPRGEHL